MSENEKIQNLLRLKRYENPGEEHVDQVLEEFRARREREKAEQPNRVQKFPMQEQAILPFGSWFDKLASWYGDLGHIRWAVPVGTAAAAAVAFTSLNNRDGMVQDIPATVINHPEEEPQNLQLIIPKSVPELSPKAKAQSGHILPANHQP